MIVDDETIIRESLRDWLSDVGHQVFTAEDGCQALSIVEKENPEIVIADLVMPKMDGISLLRKIKEISPQTEVIIITAYGSVPTAINAMREGAYGYIEKPFCPEQVELLIEKLAEYQSLRQKMARLDRFENIISQNPRMHQVIEAIKMVARLVEQAQPTEPPTQPARSGKTLREVEKNHILNVLAETQGNFTEAAKILGISRMTLYNKAKAYGINIKRTANNLASLGSDKKTK